MPDEWTGGQARSFSLDSADELNVAVDGVIASLGSDPEPLKLLGLGEAMHGAEEILLLRNRMFERLVDAHGYSAIAIESSFPRGRVVDKYVAGNLASDENPWEHGFSHGFGRLSANRELIEWMRRYNADPARKIKVRFYGFDSPTEMTGTDSPRQLLIFAASYLASIDREIGQTHRKRIEPLLGEDAAWENPAALMDPAKSIGSSLAAAELRIATEDLIVELTIRRPELIAASDRAHYLEAMQHAKIARQLLNYHAALARNSPRRLPELLGLRDAMMAESLAYAVARECDRGKVFAFAHNTHLQRGPARWQLGPRMLQWWPAGAHLSHMLGSGYAVIGSGVGISDANGIGPPESGTLEALLTALPGPVRLVRADRPQELSAFGGLSPRSASSRNSTYFPLTPQSLADFDWLLVLDSATYTRGGPPL